MQLSFRKLSGDSLAVVGAIGLGAFVRLLPVVTREFPLNDGGLFCRMTQDLIASGFRLPLMTTYNGGDIPFGYPPLGFYLLGSLHLVTGVPITELMRWLPALFSVLTIPAFYVLARHLLRRTDVAAMATLVFALIPRSHEWILMGGGITRAPGMLFSILALVQTARLLERPTWIRASLLGLLIALATLSHLEMAWFTIFSLLLLVAFRGRTAPVLARVAMAIGLGALLSGAWWIPFLARHGAAPLLLAATSGQHTSTSTAAILTNFTGEPFQGVFLVLALLAAIMSLFRRDFLLPTWLVLIVLLDPRAAGTDASLPIGMLVAIAVTQIVLPSLTPSAGVREATRDFPGDDPHGPGTYRRRFSLALAALACYGVYASVLAPFLPGSSLLVSLRPGEIEAANWINANLPVGNRFLIVSGRSAWGEDPLSEWFPALTSQVNLTTPQGKEWVGGLNEAAERHRQLQLCAERGRKCFEEWLATGEAQFDYLLVARYPPASAIQTVALEVGLGRSDDYAMVYSNADAVIYSHSPEP
jgi:hypothetical protein